MKWFHLLKGTAGKVVLGTAQLAGVSAAVGILGAGMIYNTASNHVDQQLAVRSLSGLSSGSTYEGMRRHKGQLTSINVKDALNQVATAEERAAMEGGSSNNFGLDAADNIQNNDIFRRVGSAGQAAELSGSEGLGMGANAVAEEATRAAASGGRAGDVYSAAAGAAASAAAAQANAKNAAGQRPGNTLASASMARASGNAFNAASGPVGSGSGSASAARTPRSSGSEGYQFSGSMPSGSNAVSAMGLGSASRRDNSTFVAAGRRGTVGKGGRSFGERDDLKDISKRSADAARNSHRAANEGSRAFLASSKNSGGLSVESGGDVESTASADFSAPEKAQLKAIGDWGDQAEDDAEEQEKARKELMWMIFGFIAGTLAVIPAAYWLIANGKAFLNSPEVFTKPQAIAMIVTGSILLAGMLAFAACLIWKAVEYQKNYKANFMPIASYILAAGGIAALTYTLVTALKAVAPDGNEKIGLSKFAGYSAKGLKSVGIMGGTTVAQNAISGNLDK